MARREGPRGAHRLLGSALSMLPGLCFSNSGREGEEVGESLRTFKMQSPHPMKLLQLLFCFFLPCTEAPRARPRV